MAHKDPVQLLDEADGHPQWLREVLESIFHRLPPPPPPKAPPGLAWDPMALARLQVDGACVPLTATNRWYLAQWLENLAAQLREGTLEEGDSKEGFRSIFVLGKTPPSSGRRDQ